MIRVHGDMRRINLPEMSAEEVGNMVTSVMNDHQRKIYQQNLEVDFSFELPNVARFRVNAFNTGQRLPPYSAPFPAPSYRWKN